MNQNAVLIAVIGGLAVWWFWRQQQAPAQQQTIVTDPRLVGGTWQYPAGSLPGPSPTTYTDPEGAVLFRPDAPVPVDWT